ncbi:unnamed protein product [Paramecium pentaurelia]|uniref:Uncharacterized protein n=1 Tax=Paramecium pentaurelia TaxID=43138 RepID=A0A8S1TMX1_9CILI|nr:unnamed protein product [Paramecium pentaurelia]
MSSEVITDIVQTILKDQLNEIQMKLTNLEQKVINIESQLNTERNKNHKSAQNLKTSFTSLESQFKYIIFELNEAQTMANLVMEKTEKKIMETQQLKITQNKQFDELSKSLNIQKNLEQINSNILQFAIPPQQLNQNCYSSQEQNQYQYQEEMVYKTQSGGKYHKQNCNILSNYPSVKLNIKQALKQGLTGCKICKA